MIATSTPLVQSSFSEIHEALIKAPRILVVSHARPDGDALGSTLAAVLWLKTVLRGCSQAFFWSTKKKILIASKWAIFDQFLNILSNFSK
jgi:hypothetical protein